MAVPEVLYSKHSGDMSLEADDIDEPTGEGFDTNKRSERKRQREKQRRFDLSNAFDELATFIAQVEPGAGDIELEGKKKRKKSSEGEDTSGITRLDLIGRALKMMKRLHRENEERKRIIATIQERGGSQGSNDNVLVMVPTLAPVEEAAYPVARASYPSYPPHPPHSNTNYYQQGIPFQPHGGPEYAVSVPLGERVQHQYAPSNWNPRYGASAPPHQQQLPPGTRMHPVQHVVQQPPRSPAQQRSPDLLGPGERRPG